MQRECGQTRACDSAVANSSQDAPERQPIVECRAAGDRDEQLAARAVKCDGAVHNASRRASCDAVILIFSFYLYVAHLLRLVSWSCRCQCQSAWKLER